MNMTPENLKAQLQQRVQESEALSELWRSLVDSFCPDEKQFRIWLNLHSFENVIFGVEETGRKFIKVGRNMTPEHMLRYASKCMNTKKTQAQQATEPATGAEKAA